MNDQSETNQADEEVRADQDRYIAVSETGKVSLVGTVPEGYWHCTPDERDEYIAGEGSAIHIEELRKRVQQILSVLKASGIPYDGITGFALAMLGLHNSGHPVDLGATRWRIFNAHDFHRGVMEMTPLVLENKMDGITTSYDSDGNRVPVLTRRTRMLLPSQSSRRERQPTRGLHQAKDTEKPDME